MGSQVQAFKPPSHCKMKPLIILSLVALVRSQYSGETQDLSNSQLDALKDIFGDAAGGGAYSGQQVGRLEGGTNGVEAIIQVVKNEDGYVAPGNYQVVLKEIDLPVVGHDQCESSLRTTRLGKRFQLDDSFICAGGVNGKDTCKGDGGSPLVCQSKFDPTAYVQAGIVAWGIGCGEDNTPGVYASVSKGVCWIDYAMTCQFGQQSGSYSSYWGYSAQQCQTWMNGELSRLNQEVADMQNAGSLTGRKKAAALAKGIKAQETLNTYSQCNVFWQPIDAAPLTTGGNGYVDGGDVDISNFERDNYPAAPLTDATDGYSEPKTVDTVPLTDASYSETKTVDAAPLTDGSSLEPKTAPQIIDAGETYAEDSAADLTGAVKAPGPVY